MLLNLSTRECRSRVSAAALSARRFQCTSRGGLIGVSERNDHKFVVFTSEERGRRSGVLRPCCRRDGSSMRPATDRAGGPCRKEGPVGRWRGGAEGHAVARLLDGNSRRAPGTS